MAFPGVSNEALLFALSRQGVFASMGACGFQQLGIILQACGVKEILAHSALSFCLSRHTTEGEIERAATIIANSAAKLRQLSLQIC